MADPVTTIRAMCKWLDENVCSSIRLKEPVQVGDKRRDGPGYNPHHLMVKPTVLPMFPQFGDIGSKAPAPSLTVTCLEWRAATEAPHQMDTQLTFKCWNPGTHEGDVWVPDSPVEFTQLDDPSFFEANGEGWADVWGFASLCAHILQKHRTAGPGIQLIIDGPEPPVRIQPAKGDSLNVVSLYPFWAVSLFASFRVADLTPIVQNAQYL